jgi:hypothetical protein
MKAHGVARMGSATILLAGAAAVLVAASPAAAQVSDAAVLNIMRECAKIDDPTARLACYDNNVRAGGFDGRRPVVPGEAGRVAGSGGPGGYGPAGFGSEDVKTPERFQSYEQRGIGPDAITARIASVRQREPGIYLITLEGGAEWLFTDTAPRSFRVPQRGDMVDISRASLGSFLLRFDNQTSIRVRRLR